MFTAIKPAAYVMDRANATLVAARATTTPSRQELSDVAAVDKRAHVLLAEAQANR